MELSNRCGTNTGIPMYRYVCSPFCYGLTNLHIRYLSKETLRNPRIVRVGNPQVFRGIAEDIRGIVQGCPRNRARVSAESSVSVRGIVKGCPRNRERVSAES